MDADKDVKVTPASKKRRKYRSTEEIVSSIGAAALEEFKTKGFERSTTASIARRAKVVEAQIFQYFGSKTNLFRSAIFETLNQQLDLISGEFHWEDDARTGKPSHIGQVVHTDRLQAFLTENADLIKSLFIANAYGAFESPNLGLDDSLGRYFDHGTTIMNRLNISPEGVPPHLMVRISFGAVLGCVLFRNWLFPEGVATQDDIRSGITEFVLAGLDATVVES